MTRALQTALACVSVVVVAVLAAFAGSPSGIPLITIEQGTTHSVIGGVEMFIVRQGSVIYAFPRANGVVAPDRIVWCPNEEAFVAPDDTSLFTARGEYVAGPAPRDLDQYATRLDNDLILHVDTDRILRARARSDGEVSGEAGQRYSLFRGGEPFARFCQGAIPAVPGAVPTPTSTA